MTDFIEFPKMARLTRECIITEKIDGTIAQIHITEGGVMFVGSRSRWIRVGDDNYGFAAWIDRHHDELITLGPGSHFGEWWGNGIQRKYDMAEKKFSLFNTHRWVRHGEEPKVRSGPHAKEVVYQDVLPPCCDLVPELYRGDFCTVMVDAMLHALKTNGSVAAPGFMNPEGVVVFHTAAGVGFKKTLDHNDQAKGAI